MGIRTILTICGLSISLAATADGTRTPRPDVVIANPGHCIASVEVMRRDHPDMLKHQRDITVHAGTRAARVSLNTCIECHASRVNHSVLGTTENFCQGCHQFVGVRLDCFECHQASPSGAATVASLGVLP